MSYNSLQERMDPWVQKEFETRGTLDEAIKEQCLVLYAENPSETEIVKLAEHYHDKYGDSFKEMSEATLRERLEVGRMLPRPEDWNPGISYSAHVKATKIKNAEARARVIAEATPGTTAEVLAQRVGVVRYQLGEIRKNPVAPDKNPNLNASGAFTIRDPDDGDGHWIKVKGSVSKGVVTLSLVSGTPVAGGAVQSAANGTQKIVEFTFQDDGEA